MSHIPVNPSHSGCEMLRMPAGAGTTAPHMVMHNPLQVPNIQLPLYFNPPPPSSSSPSPAQIFPPLSDVPGERVVEGATPSNTALNHLHQGRFRYTLAPHGQTSPPGPVMRATPRGTTLMGKNCPQRPIDTAECSASVLKLPKRKSEDDDDLPRSKKLLTEEQMSVKLQKIHLDQDYQRNLPGEFRAKSLQELENILDLSDTDEEENNEEEVEDRYDDDRYPRVKFSDTLKEALKKKELMQNLNLPNPNMQLVLWKPPEAIFNPSQESPPAASCSTDDCSFQETDLSSPMPPNPGHSSWPPAEHPMWLGMVNNNSMSTSFNSYPISEQASATEDGVMDFS